MSIQKFLVLIKPIFVGCINNELRSLLFKDFGLLFSSHDIQKGNSESLTVLVEHSSQGWSCSCVNHSFSFLAEMVPFLVSIDHTDHCQGIDDSWSSTFKRNIWIDFPDVGNWGNCVLCPGSSEGLEGDSFSDEFLMLRTSGFDDFPTSFEPSYKRYFCGSISSLDSEPIRGVDCRGSNFDKDFIWSGLGDLKVGKDRNGSKCLDNKCFLSLVFHKIKIS